VSCPEAPLVQAYSDGEVDALAAHTIERHMEQCSECRALYQDLLQLRTALRRDLPYFETPPALRAKVMRALDAQDGGGRRWRSPSFWLGAWSGLGTAVAAAALAYFLWLPPLTSPMVDELLGAHVGSLMSSHLVDVVSTDKHTVKPWFAGRADVSPLVVDFESEGYKLLGGRVDYLLHQRAAVLVFRHGAHVINLFSWDAGARFFPSQVTRDGYHLVFWRAGDLEYCVVSDTAQDELLGLVRLMQGAAARDPS